MSYWFLCGKGKVFGFSCGLRRGFNYQQTFSLVNVKLKWVKDKALDAVIAGERDLRAACNLVSILSSAPDFCLPIYHLSRHRGQLGLPHDHKLSTFIRRYPTIFHESYVFDSAGTLVPCFELTLEALNLYHEELGVIRDNMIDLIDRLCKLLMLTKDRILPLQTIDQLKWDLGLPYFYIDNLIPNYADLFSLFRLPDDRIGLKLLSWDDTLAVSQLEKNVARQTEEDLKNNCLAFPIGFTRGFGLKRKCMGWLEEWQKLPYTSPYADASHLDPCTDVSEKRIVGVFHELFHLTIQKKTERKNRHPLVDIRERFASMMRKGFRDRSRGLYKETAYIGHKDPLKIVQGHKGGGNGLDSEVDSDDDLFSEYNSDESIHCPT
ncbi:hypothetical protein E1A91_D02G134400v1 [Gossypium mustelinum]|uniref:PORR domain-containing protein n=1 Tax=Gossypium mustelinum TaxID=34275 RepID=A0A5D2VVF8_GOSMU|nr:hypothetical protein E1A91_D02G134400v1 [Gossypium mustelinum]